MSAVCAAADVYGGDKVSDEVQDVQSAGQPCGGAFTITVAGRDGVSWTSKSIPYCASPAEIDAAITSLFHEGWQSTETWRDRAPLL